jgi:hypothetical protein
MKKYAILSLFLLSGCAAAPAPTTITVNKSFYPSVPPITLPTPMTYYPLNFMLPVGANKEILNLKTVCPDTLTPTELKACISANTNSTNLFVGMSERNYTYLLLNLQMTKNYIAELKARLNAANNIFNYWSSKNATTSAKGK